MVVGLMISLEEREIKTVEFDAVYQFRVVFCYLKH
jgi:hypothetical protein